VRFINFTRGVTVDKSDITLILSPGKIDKPHITFILTPGKIDKPHITLTLTPGKIDKPHINLILTPGKIDKPHITLILTPMVLRSVYFMVKFQFFIPELWDFIHQIVHDFKAIFRMSCCKLRTPLPINFKLQNHPIFFQGIINVKFKVKYLHNIR
jgi:hypothetical protein